MFRTYGSLFGVYFFRHRIKIRFYKIGRADGSFFREYSSKNRKKYIIRFPNLIIPHRFLKPVRYNYTYFAASIFAFTSASVPSKTSVVVLPFSVLVTVPTVTPLTVDKLTSTLFLLYFVVSKQSVFW